MRLPAVLTALAAALAFAAPASAATYEGSGFVPLLVTECHPAAAGTGFVLDGHGASDWDIDFYSASGRYVGSSYEIGDEAGTVPAEAAEACPYLWSSDGEASFGLLFPGEASYTYTDGL